MAYVRKQEQLNSVEVVRKRDAMALAVLLLDIYKEKQRKEQRDAVS